MVRVTTLTKVKEQLHEERDNSLSLTQIEVLRQRNENAYTSFNTVHSKLVAASNRIDDALQLPYFTENTSAKANELYLESDDLLLALLSSLGATPNEKTIEITDTSNKGGESSPLGNRNAPLHSTAFPPHSPHFEHGAHNVSSDASQYMHMQSWMHNAQKINFPKFSGDYTKWRSFSQLFSHIYGSNPFYSDALKLAHLRQKLEGEPLELIEHISVDDDSFSAGWNILVDQYENPRLTYAAHLDKLVGKEWSDKNPPLNSKQIHRIRNDITENVNALKAVKAPVQYWDPIIVFAGVKRLDSKLRKEWELHLGRSTEIPTLAQFRDFLLSNARALESVEIAAGAPQPKANAPRSQFSGKAQTAARVHVAAAPQQQPSAAASFKEALKCKLCKGNHALYSCNSFNEMTQDDRSRFVKARNLCLNCTSSLHTTNACKSQRSCGICHQRHHTLLCDKPSAPSFAQVASAAQSPALTNAYPFKNQNGGASGSA